MGRLADYCLHLSEDPDALERHKASPESARQQMVEAELSEEHQELLLRGDPGDIQEALNEELGGGGDDHPGFAIPTRPGG